MEQIKFENILNNDVRLIDSYLTSFLPSAVNGQSKVVDAMKYSLMAGGKRLRPVLAMEFCRCCGGERHDALDFGCAVEFIHTYSLIHDDLPCMDDDDTRRGRPSCHIKFGESTALLAGDALLTHAFQIISESELSTSKKAKAVSLLAQNSGVGGMIGGQVLDLEYDKTAPSLRQLLTVHKLKTGALISAACLMGCIAAGASDAQIKSASKFAYNLGVAFQIQDDILDVVGDEKELGKPIGSDSENEKTTYVTKVGIEKAKSDVRVLTEKAIDCLDDFRNTEFIEQLANDLINRNH